MVGRDELVEEIDHFVSENLTVTGGGEAPRDMHDLDSFSVVRLLLHLERKFGLAVLEELPNFQGTNFQELVDFILATDRNVPAES